MTEEIKKQLLEKIQTISVAMENLEIKTSPINKSVINTVDVKIHELVELINGKLDDKKQ